MEGTLRRASATGLIALIAAVLLAACGSSSDASKGIKVSNVGQDGGMSQLAKKAKQEHTLLLYVTASQNKVQQWVKPFTAQYGIQVQIYRAPTNPLYQRFTQEEEVGKVKADILQVSDLTTVKDAVSKHYLAQYTPQTANQFPADSVVPRYAYPLYTTLSAVAWNTKATPRGLQAKLDGPNPLEALLDPRLKGKLAAVDVTAGGPQLANDANIALKLSSQYGWPYVQKLAAQDPKIYDSTTELLNAVETGNAWATDDGYDSVFGPAAVSGAPVAYRILPDTTSAEFYFGTVQQAPHPYAARLFEEWATTLKAQSSLANISQGSVLIKGWKDTRKVSKEPWYRSPKSVWGDWVTDPRISGSNLQPFYTKWQGIMGKSG